MRLIIQPTAQEEIIDAYRWYSQRSAQLGKQFLSEVDFCLDAIAHETLRFPKVRHEIRKARFNKFPYSFYFVVDDTRKQIAVTACFHSRRNPKLWQNR